jgi:hypothetical protein
MSGGAWGFVYLIASVAVAAVVRSVVYRVTSRRG